MTKPRSTPKLLGIPSAKKPPNHELSTEQLMDRRDKVFQMRIEGKSVPTIAQALGVSLGTVYNDRKEIAKLKYQGLIEKDETLLMETNAQLDAVIENQIEFALDKNLKVAQEKVNNGETTFVELPLWQSAGAAVDRLLKALELRAKINGFYTPRTPEPKGNEGTISNTLLQIIYNGVNKSTNQATIVEGELLDG